MQSLVTHTLLELLNGNAGCSPRLGNERLGAVLILNWLPDLHEGREALWTLNGPPRFLRNDSHLLHNALLRHHLREETRSVL